MREFGKWGVLFVIGTLTIHFYLSAFNLVPQYFDSLNDRLYYFVRGASHADAQPAAVANVATEQSPEDEQSSKELVFEYGPSEKPMGIEIEKIGVQANIIIPTGTKNDVLDKALEEGVVYYPGSGRLGEEGNVFLFGHSSWLPSVQNHNFAIFNGLKNLTIGDRISILSQEKRYLYEVIAVRAVPKEEAWVDFKKTELHKLTLSSCNTFGKAQDRVVVEALLVDTLKL